MTKLNTPVHISSTNSLSSTSATATKIIAKRTPTLHTVPLADILRDKTLQVRSGIRQQVVHKYAEAMHNGEEFPPITLAYINGSLVLVDGWHRVAATERNERGSILAHVSRMTMDEALWQAAEANKKHGIPLNNKEYRNVFRAFIEAGMYRKGYSWLSYREIGKQVGKRHNTIRNWMKEDYPEIFKRHQEDATVTEDRLLNRKQKVMQKRLKQAEGAIRDARNIGRTLDPELLGKLIDKFKRTLWELRTMPFEPVVVPVGEFAADF